MILVDTVNGNKLYRGPRPAVQGDLLGINTDINLETGWFEFLHGECKEEMGWCKALNVTYLFRPQSDITPPSLFTLKNIVDQINISVKAGNVLVHCLHGEDRTGMVMAAYRMIMQNWSFEKAKTEMLGYGFHTFPYGWWINTLQGLDKS